MKVISGLIPNWAQYSLYSVPSASLEDIVKLSAIDKKSFLATTTSRWASSNLARLCINVS